MSTRDTLGHLASMAALLVLIAIVGHGHAAQSAQGSDHGARAREPIVGLPCEGCDAVFQGMPETPGPEARIGRPGEPGAPLELEGVVRFRDGRPAPGIVVYAYQTDAGGRYPPDERFAGQSAGRHGRLRAWARTGADGRYRFQTIRPGSYPGTSIPQHIHLHVIEPGRCTYYIEDVHFDDDPFLTARERESASRGRGGVGIVRPLREAGAWRATRDIELGRGIPGYDGCAARSR